jgi:hypothetical protein
VSSIEGRRAAFARYSGGEPAQLADVLERVLDKGIVIAGDIRIDLVGVELLTLRLRLLVASAEKAKELGIDWWEQDPFYSSSAARRQLEQRIEQLEEALQDRGREGARDGDASPDE